MQNRELERRVEDLKARVRGRWREALLACGVPTQVLNRRNQPCPSCGGTDRFQFTDKYGAGNYYCRGCGPGDGFKLLQACCGLDFLGAVKRIEQYVGVALNARPELPAEPAPERMKKLARRIWEEAQPVVAGDDVGRYLRGRGLQMAVYPAVLRCHPCLGYYEKDEGGGKSKKVAEYPAMLAAVQGADGHAITLHRTYLHDGRKANARDAKKLLSAGINGAAVRLFDPSEEIAIAEGVETALAVHLATGKPVWSALSAGNLEKLWLPESVRCVHIYADNDADSSYDGEAAAYALARRLKKEAKKRTARDVHVHVHVPPQAGDDWADVWLRRRPRLRRAA
ncbi:MAG TPA: toprim domain-containing protein [Burkholderiaceae bacterium]|nr:toprim domain-containing protein [Burkholderiaceae bacterium]